MPFPSPGDLSDQGIKPASPASPALVGGFFTTTWEALSSIIPSPKLETNKSKEVLMQEGGPACEMAGLVRELVRWASDHHPGSNVGMQETL